MYLTPCLRDIPSLLSAKDTATSLQVHIERGLSEEQVTQRQIKYGTNELETEDRVPWYKIFAKQLFNAMNIVLVFALGLSAGIKDYVEAGVLTFVVAFNVSVGFWQEFSAEKKMDALRALSSPSAMVLREGRTQIIPNAQVVPGDIVLLKMGDTVPADLRLFEAMNLTAEEGQLTGESAPVEKTISCNFNTPDSEDNPQAEDIGIGDRINLAYATTTILKGRGRGIVVATGMNTEVGKIAASTTKKRKKAGRSMNWKKYGKSQPIVGLSKRIYDAVGRFLGLVEGTPLQRKLSILAYSLFGIAIVLAMIVFGVNKFDLRHEVIIYATSVGVAIIPECLVAVLTLTMVNAVAVMRKQNLIVRDLSAIEALGGVTNICSDKTGTLTEGAMIVRKIWLASADVYAVEDAENPNDPTKSQVMYFPNRAKEETQKRGDIEAKGHPPGTETAHSGIRFEVPDTVVEESKGQPVTELNDELRTFLLSAALCNLATVNYNDVEKVWQTTGEPTEIALQVFAHRFKQDKKMMEALGWTQVAEFPFDSSIKRMSVIYDPPEDTTGAVVKPRPSIVLTKGAVERILDLCSHSGMADRREVMTDTRKEEILAQMTKLAAQGQRVLALAQRTLDDRFNPRHFTSGAEVEQDMRANVEQNLTFLGLAGIYDPPRRETALSIFESSQAGIKIHMLTGDHPATAQAIAKEVGIIPKNLGELPSNITSSLVMKASDFDKMTDEEMDALEDLPYVIARCAPDTKARMIEALRRRGAFMAMTGDGVNDAPSLSRADIGIAMGSGSDVAKSAAEIVLSDDKFDSIVVAIREGRRMFYNIQKFALHLLASNVGEVLLLIVGLAFVDSEGFSVFPISPLQIIYINLCTSSTPAFGLGREKAAHDVMRRPPQDQKRGIFTWEIIADMMIYGTIMGMCTLSTFVIIVWGAGGGELGVSCNTTYSESCNAVFRARAAVFAELTWQILVSAWEFKSIRRSLFALKPNDERPLAAFRDVWENQLLFWSVVGGALSVVPLIYIPKLNTSFLKHKGITWEWALSIGFTILFVAGIELWKLSKRLFRLFEEKPVNPGRLKQGEATLRMKRTLSEISFVSWTGIKRVWTGDSARNASAATSV